MAIKKKLIDTTFETWVRKTGTRELSILLNVTEMAVKNWLKQIALPQAYHMRRIKQLSKGKVDYVHIIEGSTSPLSRQTNII